MNVGHQENQHQLITPTLTQQQHNQENAIIRVKPDYYIRGGASDQPNRHLQFPYHQGHVLADSANPRERGSTSSLGSLHQFRPVQVAQPNVHHERHRQAAASSSHWQAVPLFNQHERPAPTKTENSKLYYPKLVTNGAGLGAGWVSSTAWSRLPLTPHTQQQAHQINIIREHSPPIHMSKAQLDGVQGALPHATQWRATPVQLAIVPPAPSNHDQRLINEQDPNPDEEDESSSTSEESAGNDPPIDVTGGVGHESDNENQSVDPNSGEEQEDRAGRRSFSESEDETTERDSHGRPIVRRRSHIINGRPIEKPTSSSVNVDQAEDKKGAKFDSLVEEIEAAEPVAEEYDESEAPNLKDPADESRLVSQRVKAPNNKTSTMTTKEKQIASKHIGLKKPIDYNKPKTNMVTSKNSAQGSELEAAGVEDSTTQIGSELDFEPKTKKEEHKHNLKESLKAKQWDDTSNDNNNKSNLQDNTIHDESDSTRNQMELETNKDGVEFSDLDLFANPSKFPFMSDSEDENDPMSSSSIQASQDVEQDPVAERKPEQADEDSQAKDHNQEYQDPDTLNTNKRKKRDLESTSINDEDKANGLGKVLSAVMNRMSFDNVTTAKPSGPEDTRFEPELSLEAPPSIENPGLDNQLVDQIYHDHDQEEQPRRQDLYNHNNQLINATNLLYNNISSAPTDAFYQHQQMNGHSEPKINQTTSDFFNASRPHDPLQLVSADMDQQSGQSLKSNGVPFNTSAILTNNFYEAQGARGPEAANQSPMTLGLSTTNSHSNGHQMGLAGPNMGGTDADSQSYLVQPGYYDDPRLGAAAPPEAQHYIQDERSILVPPAPGTQLLLHPNFQNPTPLGSRSVMQKKSKKKKKKKKMREKENKSKKKQFVKGSSMKKKAKLYKGDEKKRKRKAAKRYSNGLKEFKGLTKGSNAKKGLGLRGSKKGTLFYKDKGYKKRGFKKAYQKLESGDHKTYFDEFRDKDSKKKWKNFKDKHQYR